MLNTATGELRTLNCSGSVVDEESYRAVKLD